MTIEQLDPIAIDGELIRIAITDITPASDNPRHDLGDLADLAASIKTIGIIHAPVVTAGPEDDTWTIVAGHRRVAAAKKAGLREIDCVVRANLSDAQRIEAMALENLQREDLKPTEVATAFASLVSLGLNQREVAAKVRRTQPHVSRYIKLLELPEKARTAVDTGGITIETGVELTKRDEATVTKLLAGGAVSVWKVEEAIHSAAAKRKHDRLAKPLIKAGLKHLGRSDYMKWETCTKNQATAFWFGWGDAVVYVRAKPDTKASPNGSGKPKKETAAERRIREAREKATAEREARERERLTAITAAVNDDELVVGALFASWIIEDVDLDEDNVQVVLDALGLARADDTTDAGDRLLAYAATDAEHAVRVAVALALSIPPYGGGGDWARAVSLTMLEAHGYGLDDDDTALIAKVHDQQTEARTRGYFVGDDRRPSSGTDHTADGAFVDKHDLQPGDFVDDDGTITRAAD